MPQNIIIFAKTRLKPSEILDDGSPLKVAAIQTDGITEKTASNGVQIGSPLKVAAIQTDGITEKTASNGVQIGSPLKVDAIQEKTASHGIIANISGKATGLGGSMGNSSDGSVRCGYFPFVIISGLDSGFFQVMRPGVYHLYVDMRSGGGTISSIQKWTVGGSSSNIAASLTVSSNSQLNVGTVTLAAGDIIVVQNASNAGIVTLKNSDGMCY
nr:hypothetical protein [uncultured Methanoregula sp.]